jgi:hypothetical protein
MMARLAVIAAAGFAILWVSPSPQSGARASETAARAQPAEWSAVRKRRYVRYYRKPAYAYRVPSYGRVGDPSLGPDGRPYRRPYNLGGCVYDEGYGRFSACPNR